MEGNHDAAITSFYFESVRDFWDADVLDSQVTLVLKGRFQGRLQKGLFEDGKLREFRQDDIACGGRPDTLIVMHVLNHDRGSNYDRMQPPPPRTGLFSTFMEEVEDVGNREGCRQIVVEDVFNEFLPGKLEDLGYLRVPGSDNSHPNHVKFLPAG